MASKQQPVVVTTEFKGVFFGYVDAKQKLDVDTIRIEKARMCVYWSTDVRGALGLAATGPTTGCKVGPAVPAITLKKVTSIMEVSPEAAEKWEGGPWQK